MVEVVGYGGRSGLDRAYFDEPGSDCYTDFL